MPGYGLALHKFENLPILKSLMRKFSEMFIQKIQNIYFPSGRIGL